MAASSRHAERMDMHWSVLCDVISTLCYMVGEWKFLLFLNETGPKYMPGARVIWNCEIMHKIRKQFGQAMRDRLKLFQITFNRKTANNVYVSTRQPDLK